MTTLRYKALGPAWILAISLLALGEGCASNVKTQAMPTVGWSVGNGLVLGNATAYLVSEALISAPSIPISAHQDFPGIPFVAKEGWGIISYSSDPQSCHTTSAVFVHITSAMETILVVNIVAQPGQASSTSFTLHFPSGLDLGAGLRTEFFDDGCHPSDFRITMTFAR